MAEDRTRWQAADYAAAEDWPGYFDAVSGKPARETLRRALELFEGEGPSVEPRLAVDLGAGEGRDTAELLRRGWRVEAIDAHPESVSRIRSRPDLVGTDRLATTVGTFEECFIPRCALVNASYALPFCEPSLFEGVWRKVRGAVAPGGRFAGQFFGDRDTWASIPGRTHVTEVRARALLEGWVVEHFEVEESDKPDASGRPKHWHIFHIVARNPAGAGPRNGA